jgi:hypothetical protein
LKIKKFAVLQNKKNSSFIKKVMSGGRGAQCTERGVVD